MNRKVEISLFAGGGELLLVGSKMADHQNGNQNEAEDGSDDTNNSANEDDDENDHANPPNGNRNNDPSGGFHRQRQNNAVNPNPSTTNNVVPMVNNEREDLGMIEEYLLKITDSFSVSPPITITTSALFLNSEGLSVSSCGMFLLCVMYPTSLLC